MKIKLAKYTSVWNLLRLSSSSEISSPFIPSSLLSFEIKLILLVFSYLKLIIDYNHNDHNFNLCVSHHCQQLEQCHMLRCKFQVCQSCKLLLLKKIHLHSAESAEKKMDLVFTNYCCKLGYISKLLALKFYIVY